MRLMSTIYAHMFVSEFTTNKIKTIRDILECSHIALPSNCIYLITHSRKHPHTHTNTKPNDVSSIVMFLYLQTEPKFENNSIGRTNWPIIIMRSTFTGHEQFRHGRPYVWSNCVSVTLIAYVQPNYIYSELVDICTFAMVGNQQLSGKQTVACQNSLYWHSNRSYVNPICGIVAQISLCRAQTHKHT